MIELDIPNQTLTVNGVPISLDVLRTLTDPDSRRLYRFQRLGRPSGSCVVVHEALPTMTPEVAEEIDHEVQRAERHGKHFASLHEAYAVILEEVDEVWQIALQKRRERDPAELRKELIQVAAMAVKALQSMDNFIGGSV